MTRRGTGGKRALPRATRIGREGAAARRERAGRIARRLAEVYPDADCELDYRSPWQLLVATILSAQCTDKMVNQVTPALFEEFPDAESLARASATRLEALIRRTGFFKQKAKALKACAAEIAGRHRGHVPADLDELVRLPGVGRKTASVVIGTAFGQPAVFVDTHVNRLSRRLGLTRAETAERIEPEIRALLPPASWTKFCHRLIHHGRRVCTARAPACGECPLLDLCPQVGVGAGGTRKSNVKSAS